MKLLSTLLTILLVGSMMSGCGELNSFTMNDMSGDLPREEQVQESSKSILNMTDLEIIKKTADYLKSCGETLTFQETEINYFHSETEAVIFKDVKNQDVLYKGDYLQIKYYPHSSASSENPSSMIVVYIGEKGKVLGYCKESLSE